MINIIKHHKLSRSTYKFIVLFNVSDWLTGTFIDACGSSLFLGHPWPPITFCCCVCDILILDFVIDFRVFLDSPFVGISPHSFKHTIVIFYYQFVSNLHYQKVFF